MTVGAVQFVRSVADATQYWLYFATSSDIQSKMFPSSHGRLLLRGSTAFQHSIIKIVTKLHYSRTTSMGRKKTAPIQTEAQHRIAASPATLEVLEALQLGGAATVAELGPRLGRKANSLHYHIRKLLKTDLVVIVGTRRSGARTETIYDVVADRFVGPTAPADERLQKIINGAVSSLLRASDRDFTHATANCKALVDEGPHCNIFADRIKARLTSEQLLQVNEHVAALRQIFQSNYTDQQGQLHVMTMVLSPIVQAEDQPDLQQKDKPCRS